jgi:hypothetical protein
VQEALDQGSDGEYPEERRTSACGDGCQLTEPQFSDSSMNLHTHDKSRRTMAVANLVTTTSNLAESNDKSEGSNMINGQADSIESPTGEGNYGNVRGPVILPETFANKQQAWAFRQMQDIEAEIQALKGDADGRTRTIALIDRDLRDLEEEYYNYDQATIPVIVTKFKEITDDYNGKLEILKANLMKRAASELRELDEEYQKRVDSHNQLKEEYDQTVDMMTSKLLNLGESRRDEVDRLNNNALEISRKVKGLMCYEGIIKYLNSEAKGSSLTDNSLIVNGRHSVRDAA